MRAMSPPARTTAALAALALVLTSCATVPYTGRRQLSIMSAAQETQLGNQAYASLTRRSLIAHDTRANAIVREVGRRIADAADQPSWTWELTLFDDREQVNAWALPGGKVGVYTGIFPVAEHEAGLATVVGHEVAHALAHHSAERASQQTFLGLIAGGLAAAADVTLGGSGGLAQQTLSLGAQLGILLPFSRAQESEADEIGLILMAKAGYDPRAALGVWDRMAAVERQQATPPEFLSTHPSYGTRVARIEAALPRALRYYRPDASPDRRLPALADLEPPDPAEAEIIAGVSRIDKLASRKETARTLPYVIAAEFRTRPERVADLQKETDFSPGETALALALLTGTATQLDALVRDLERSRRWYDVVRASGASPRAVGTGLAAIAERATRGDR